MLAARLAEVEARLGGRDPGEAASAERQRALLLDTNVVYATLARRLAEHRTAVDAAPRAAARAPTPSRPTRHGRAPTSSTSCAASGPGSRRSCSSSASSRRVPRSARRSRASGSRRPIEALRTEYDVEPHGGARRGGTRGARGHDARRARPRARARPAAHGPDQPARARGVPRAARALRVPAGAARRREVNSRRELNRVIRAVDKRDRRRVRRRRSRTSPSTSPSLFTTLFPGGSGRLSLVDPDDLLDTGIEIEARPSGKNVRRLSLLSGGERSLTALAYLFAVFRARPSPFYLLDEVEAALDDVNLHRFLDLVHEFRDEAQLVIVTHQKRTMEAADILYGVSMPPGGSTRVVSQRAADVFAGVAPRVRSDDRRCDPQTDAALRRAAAPSDELALHDRLPHHRQRERGRGRRRARGSRCASCSSSLLAWIAVRILHRVVTAHRAQASATSGSLGDARQQTTRPAGHRGLASPAPRPARRHDRARCCATSSVDRRLDHRGR